MGLFSFLSQLAQEGYSSQEDSTRKRRSESVGGLEWPSRREVTFLQVAVVILRYSVRCEAKVHTAYCIMRNISQSTPKTTIQKQAKRLTKVTKNQLVSVRIVIFHNFLQIILAKFPHLECAVFCVGRER